MRDAVPQRCQSQPEVACPSEAQASDLAVLKLQQSAQMAVQNALANQPHLAVNIHTIVPEHTALRPPH